jgi:hypothetical protein
MNSLPDGATQSWFIVKVAVALSPILTFRAAGVIGWFLRRRLRVRHGGNDPVERVVGFSCMSCRQLRLSPSPTTIGRDAIPPKISCL